MGYRHYMCVVERKRIDEIRNLSSPELEKYAASQGIYDEDDEDCGFSEYSFLMALCRGNEFHEFGKYYENAENVYTLGTPLFSDKETQSRFDDFIPYVVEQDAVLCAINDYKQKVIDWYKGLLMTQEEYDASLEWFERRGLTQEQRIRAHLEKQLSEWENQFGFTAINTDMKSKQIVTSWLYEYQIFELVYRMKTMDWEKNTLLFLGW